MPGHAVACLHVRQSTRPSIVEGVTYTVQRSAVYQHCYARPHGDISY